MKGSQVFHYCLFLFVGLAFGCGVEPSSEPVSATSSSASEKNKSDKTDARTQNDGELEIDDERSGADSVKESTGDQNETGAGDGDSSSSDPAGVGADPDGSNVLPETPPPGLDQETIATYMEAINVLRSSSQTCGDAAMESTHNLVWSNTLYEAALRHSNDMVDNGFSGHTGSDGTSPFDRVADTGYSFASGGENVAAGFRSIDSVFSAWMSSPGHCTNIMGGYFTEFAMAEVNGRWTQVFARPR